MACGPIDDGPTTPLQSGPEINRNHKLDFFLKARRLARAANNQKIKSSQSHDFDSSQPCESTSLDREDFILFGYF